MAAAAEAYWPLVLLALLHAGWHAVRLRRLSVEWSATLLVIVSWAGFATGFGGDHFALFRFYVPLMPILAAGKPP